MFYIKNVKRECESDMRLSRDKFLQVIRNDEWVVKFFDKEEYADAMRTDGDILIRPLKYFQKSTEKGRSDPNAGRVSGVGVIYVKDEDTDKYVRLVSYDSSYQDLDTPVFCMYGISNQNMDEIVFRLDPKMYELFGRHLVFVRIKELYKKIYKCTGGKINFRIETMQYCDSDFTSEEQSAIGMRKSDKHLFTTKKQNSFMQEMRCVFGVKYDDLIKEKYISKANNVDIQDGCLLKLGCLEHPISRSKFMIINTNQR
jgi:hypothetical protein